MGILHPIPPERNLVKRIPRLLETARRGEAVFFLQFGGQGGLFLPELRRLRIEFEFLDPFLEVACDAVRDLLERDDVRPFRKETYPHEFRLRDWLRGRSIPPDSYLFDSQISLAGNLIVQLSYLRILAESGFAPHEMARYTRGCTGHSQGIVGAVACALARDGHDFLQMTYDFTHWFALAGFFMATRYKPPSVPEELLEFSISHDGEAPRPMAVVNGLPESQLSDLIEKFNATEGVAPLGISLRNGDAINVVTGHPCDLALFRMRNIQSLETSGASWNYVPVSAPFHHAPVLQHLLSPFLQMSAGFGMPYSGRDLVFPVYSFTDGRNLQEEGDLFAVLADLMMNGILDWRIAIRALKDDPLVTHVLDFGPGRGSAMLTHATLGKRRIAVLYAAGRSGIRNILAHAGSSS